MIVVENKEKIMQIYTPQDKLQILPLPFFDSLVSAGFPSPADDYIDRQLDLNDYLIQHPAATFFVRVEGNSMQEVGINSGDIIIVDRSITPKSGQIVLAVLDGEFTLKRLKKQGEKVYLVPENKSYSAIMVRPEQDFQIWGVITGVVRKVT